MSDELRVQQLLDEILDSERTPEEVCADCPELLAEVRQRWHVVRVEPRRFGRARVDEHLGALRRDRRGCRQQTRGVCDA